MNQLHSQTVYYTLIPKKHMSMRHILMGMRWTNQHRSVNTNSKQTNMIIITSNNLKSRTTEPIQSNSTQITNPCSKHHISQIINNTSQNHENTTINMKYKERIEKPIPFSRRLKMKKWATMKVFVRNMVGLREVLSGKTMKRH